MVEHMTGEALGRSSTVRAIAFDVDRTLTPSNSWEVLASVFGTDLARVGRLWTAYRHVSLDYEHTKSKLLGLWRSSGQPTRTTLCDAFQRLPLRPEAHGLIETLREMRLPVCLISSSVDLYVEVVAARLGIPEYFANITLEFGENGELVDMHFETDIAGQKVRQLLQFCERRQIAPREMLVVGDGINDLDLFEFTKNGVLLVNEENVDLARHAAHTISALDQVLDLVDQ